jgi:hypothetical protein
MLSKRAVTSSIGSPVGVGDCCSRFGDCLGADANVSLGAGGVVTVTTSSYRTAVMIPSWKMARPARSKGILFPCGLLASLELTFIEHWLNPAPSFATDIVELLVRMHLRVVEYLRQWNPWHAPKRGYRVAGLSALMSTERADGKTAARFCSDHRARRNS